MYNRSSKVFSWLENLAITSAIPLVTLAFIPDDPFLLQTGFPWVVLAPVLIGLRYGFSHGFASALTLIAGLGFHLHMQEIPMADFPMALSLGLLLAGMVTGEFRDYWARCLQRLDAKYAHQQIRLEEFSRVYHILKASHARLEQQVAGASVSLRRSLLTIREQMANTEFQKDAPLGGFGEPILRIFSEYGGIQMAAIYEVVKSQDIDPAPAAQLGNPPIVSASNPLVLETLKTGQAVGVRAENLPAADGVLAAIPLVDVQGQIWGVVTVNEIPFIDFHDKKLELLTIIGGYLGDAISNPSQVNSDQPIAADAFRSHLERCLMDVRRFGVSAGLVTISIPNSGLLAALFKLIRLQSRGLDQIWVPSITQQAGVICVLMPFTDAQGIADYTYRLESLLQVEFGMTQQQAGITLKVRALTPRHRTAKLLSEIKQTSEENKNIRTLTKNEYFTLDNAA